MDNLPPCVFHYLLEFIDDKSIINFMQIDSNTYKRCKKFIEQISKKPKEKLIKTNRYLGYFAKVERLNRKINRGLNCAEEFKFDDIDLHNVCQLGYSEFIYFYKGKHWNSGFNGACNGENIKLMKQMVTKGADNWEGCLFSGCEKGNMEIIDLSIIWGAKDWNHGLKGACFGGKSEPVNISIIEKMINNGANNWNNCMYAACVGGNIKIINILIELGASDWNEGLRGACIKGNIKIIEFMIENGASDWDGGLSYACQGGKAVAIKMMIERGASYCDWCEGEKHDLPRITHNF